MSLVKTILEYGELLQSAALLHDCRSLPNVVSVRLGMACGGGAAL